MQRCQVSGCDKRASEEVSLPVGDTSEVVHGVNVCVEHAERFKTKSLNAPKTLVKLLKHNLGVAVGVGFMFGPLIYFMVGKKNQKQGGS